MGRLSFEILRNRILLVGLIVATLILGLASRIYPEIFPLFLAEYLGDTLWALLVFWLLGFVFIKIPSISLASIALLFSYLIEISQLYHAAWIDAIRKSTLGSLVLGHGFLWTDIICYTVGVALGFLIEFFIYGKNLKSRI